MMFCLTFIPYNFYKVRSKNHRKPKTWIILYEHFLNTESETTQNIKQHQL